LFLELLLPLMLFCMSHLHFPGLLVLLSLQILQLQLLLLLEQRQAETLELGHTCNLGVLPEQKIWSYKTTVGYMDKLVEVYYPKLANKPYNITVSHIIMKSIPL
jgi:hypothetical protein